MTVTVISPNELVRRFARSLRLPVEGTSLTTHLVAQALRRAAHILAPCSRPQLERAVRQSLSGLGTDDEARHACVQETLETLIVYGDILELRPAVDDPWHTSPFVLRPAPPTFIIRRDGSAVVLGVAGDEITPFTDEINTRVVYEGTLRVLAVERDQELRPLLRELGLIELTESVWLRLPAVQTPSACLAAWCQNLDAAPASGPINGLRILDTPQPTAFYLKRWIAPATVHTGVYVARRAQRYGAELWCLVDLHRGVPRRFFDLVSSGDCLRPCDIAWRIQMAIDAQSGAPQRFGMREAHNGVIFDFLSPLPSWAERKLAVSGRRTERHKSLLSYFVPDTEVETQKRFLQEYLWLQPEQQN